MQAIQTWNTFDDHEQVEDLQACEAYEAHLAGLAELKQHLPPRELAAILELRGEWDWQAA